MNLHDGGSPSRIPWPPIILLAALALGFLLQAVLAIPWPDGVPRRALRWAGIVLVVAALALIAWAVATLRRHETTFRVDRGAPALVTDGPFGHSRNAIYLGFLGIIAGAGLATGNAWLLLLAPVVAVVIHRLAILREERHLQARFGEAWRAYSAVVRRWL